MKRSEVLAVLNNADMEVRAKTDAILDLYGTDAELWKAQKAELTEQHKATIDSLNAKLAAVPKGDGTDYKAQFEELQAKLTEMETAHAEALQAKETELSEYKAGVESEKDKTALEAALERHLKAAGANPDPLIFEGLMSKFDRSALVREGEKITNWDEVLAPVKESNAKYFGTQATRAADVADPPANNTSSYTMDDIKKMSTEQINKNWDAVKTTLGKGK